MKRDAWDGGAPIYNRLTPQATACARAFWRCVHIRTLVAVVWAKPTTSGHSGSTPSLGPTGPYWLPQGMRENVTGVLKISGRAAVRTFVATFVVTFVAELSRLLTRDRLSGTGVGGQGGGLSGFSGAKALAVREGVWSRKIVPGKDRGDVVADVSG